MENNDDLIFEGGYYDSQNSSYLILLCAIFGFPLWLLKPNGIFFYLGLLVAIYLWGMVFIRKSKYYATHAEFFFPLRPNFFNKRKIRVEYESTFRIVYVDPSSERNQIYFANFPLSLSLRVLFYSLLNELWFSSVVPDEKKVISILTKFLKYKIPIEIRMQQENYDDIIIGLRAEKARFKIVDRKNLIPID